MDTWSSEKPERKNYEPHAEGSYPAVCVDVYTMEVPNIYKGQVSKFTGEVDNRETVTKACIGFLTSETIEIDGVTKPRYTSFWAPMSWHEKSKLRGFVTKWLKSVGEKDTVDPQALIGETAMVSVEQYKKRDGGIGHSVTVAMPLPKALMSAVPDIPDDFERHADRVKRKAAEGQEPAKAAPKAQANDEVNDLPF